MINADATGASQAMDGVSKKMAALTSQKAPSLPTPTGSTWDKLAGLTNGAGGIWDKLGENIGGVGMRLGMVGLVATAAIASIAAVAVAIQPFIKLNSELEDTQMRFKVLLGDAAKGRAAFAETKEYADKTPYSLKDAAAARGRLLAAGITDKETLTDAGNLAAAGGRPIEEAAAAFARLKSGAAGEAMEALRAMNVSQTMFEGEGINFNKSGEALATATEMTDALRRIVRDNFGGLTDELAKNWSGLWSTFRDTVDNAMVSVSSGSFPWLKDAIAAVTAELNELLKSEKLAQFGNALGAIVGACVGAVKSLSVVFEPLAGVIGGALIFALAAAASSVSTLVMGMRQLANAAQLVIDLAKFRGTGAIDDAMKRSDAIGKDYAKQQKQAFAAMTGEKYDPNESSEATNKQAKELSKAKTEAIEARKAAAANTTRTNAANEAAWAVDKARGRDAVALAQAENLAAKQNLEIMREKENAVKSAMDASDQSRAAAGRPVATPTYKKSADLMAAEVAYAKSLEALFAAAIAKAETLGQFITKTSVLMAEAAAIDARGGDSSVKRYQALKSACDEYLESLKGIREAQQQAATASAMMQAATVAAKTDNLPQLQGQTDVIAQKERIFHAQALQERLSGIQQLSQMQQLGARERNALYEQERKVFTELTSGIGAAIAETMQKIDAMQQKAIGAASSAMGILEKVKGTKGDYEQVASAMRGMNLDPSKMGLSALGQLANVAESLKKNGVNADDLKPTAGNVIGAMLKEMNAAKDTISTLKEGLTTLVDLSASIGAQSADGFFAPWLDKISLLKENLMELAGINSNIGNLPSGKLPAAAGQTTQNVSYNTEVSAQTTVQIQGYTATDVDAIIEKAKDKFATELKAAMQTAKADLGF